MVGGRIRSFSHLRLTYSATLLSTFKFPKWITAFLPVGFLPATKVQSWSSSSSSTSSLFHWGCSARLQMLAWAWVGCFFVCSWVETLVVGRFFSVTRSVRGSAPDLVRLPGFNCEASEYVTASVYAFGSAWAVSVSGVGECVSVRWYRARFDIVDTSGQFFFTSLCLVAKVCQPLGEWLDSSLKLVDFLFSLLAPISHRSAGIRTFDIRTLFSFALLAFVLLASHWCRSHFGFSHSCRTSCIGALEYGVLGVTRMTKAAFTRIQISGYLDIRISEIRISSGRLHVSDRNVFGVYTCPDIRMHYTRHTRYVLEKYANAFFFVKLHVFKFSSIFPSFFWCLLAGRQGQSFVWYVQ